jgi:hypothetical protein
MSNLSRRSIVTSAAALPALAIPAVAVAVSPGRDPIFAAIETHRRSDAEWIERVKFENDVAEEIPAERRYLSSDESTEGRDARHVAAVKATLAANDRMDDTACALSGVEPTSIAGVTALLTYFAEIDSKDGGHGSSFPDKLLDDDDPGGNKSWGAPYSYFIVRNAARSLSKLAVQS